MELKKVANIKFEKIWRMTFQKQGNNESVLTSALIMNEEIKEIQVENVTEENYAVQREIQNRKM